MPCAGAVWGGVFDISHPQSAIDLLARTFNFRRTAFFVLWEGDTLPTMLGQGSDT